jgi:hypothetical protein
VCGKKRKDNKKLEKSMMSGDSDKPFFEKQVMGENFFFKNQENCK